MIVTFLFSNKYTHISEVTLVFHWACAIFALEPLAHSVGGWVKTF